MAFEQINIGGWLIEVDREVTQAAYVNAPPINVCSCMECRNYYAACLAHTAYSPTAIAFFQKLGIAPEKEAEVYIFYPNQEKTHGYYGGFYHLVGRMIQKSTEPDYTPIGGKTPEYTGINDRLYVSIDGQFRVAFSEENHLLADHFPRPALQMEFESLIPWLLEKNHLDTFLS
jgi:hypothetical protein